MSPWLRLLARVTAPIVNTVNRVIQAVAPESQFAQAAQTFTQSVNTTAGLTRGNTPVSFSDTVRGTEPRPAAAPTSTSDRLRDTGTGAYSAPAPTPAQPTMTAEQRRQAELNRQAETSNQRLTFVDPAHRPSSNVGELHQSEAGRTFYVASGASEPGGFRTTGSLNPIRDLLWFTYGLIDDYFFPQAARVRNLDDISFNILTHVLYANDGDIPLTLQQMFNIEPEEVSEEDVQIVYKMVASTGTFNRNATQSNYTPIRRNRPAQEAPPHQEQDNSSNKEKYTMGYYGVSLSDTVREVQIYEDHMQGVVISIYADIQDLVAIGEFGATATERGVKEFRILSDLVAKYTNNNQKDYIYVMNTLLLGYSTSGNLPVADIGLNDLLTVVGRPLEDLPDVLPEGYEIIEIGGVGLSPDYADPYPDDADQNQIGHHIWAHIATTASSDVSPVIGDIASTIGNIFHDVLQPFGFKSWNDVLASEVGGTLGIELREMSPDEFGEYFETVFSQSYFDHLLYRQLHPEFSMRLLIEMGYFPDYFFEGYHMAEWLEEKIPLYQEPK